MSALVAGKFKQRLMWWVLVVVGCALLYPFAKRTFPGRLIRFFVTQQPFGHQIPNDLADDVRDKRRLALLQEWTYRNYKPKEMDEQDVYPQIWVRDGEEGFEYAWQHFEALRSLLAEAQIRKQGLLVYHC